MSKFTDDLLGNALMLIFIFMLVVLAVATIGWIIITIWYVITSGAWPYVLAGIGAFIGIVLIITLAGLRL